MARVVLPAEYRELAGGQAEVEVEASTVRRLIATLEARFPGLGEELDRRMAFAIDGVIHQDAWGAEIGPDSEVFLIPKIGGG
mgnify:CR=1 FL=1